MVCVSLFGLTCLFYVRLEGLAYVCNVYSINATQRWSQPTVGNKPQLGPLRNVDCACYTGAMARWPRHVWTSIFTYGTVFVLFPLLCLLAYGWVRGWIF